MRQIGAAVLAELENKCPGQEHRSVLGGYYFLRFICPSIVSPEVFFASPSTEATEGEDGPIVVPRIARRALILVSKTLQQLANGIPFGEKEPYMVVCNLFLSNHRSSMNSLFSDLVVRKFFFTFS
jgi:hypothetical protein